MKAIEKISENKNYTAVNIGSLDKLPEYAVVHPKNGQEIKGKVFVKEATGATGTEVSFSMLSPQTELSYFHIHRKDEETYIFLKGSGYFQVDEDCFPISEGSVVRVAPQGKRGMCNSSDEPMIYVCIQSKEYSLEEYWTDDGERVACEPKWKL
jgi:mannose-6-phosphate isomerase-like protein (cupin superfamily)